MLTELQIQNYRGFKGLKVDSLARINLIAGSNNVGKTTLLEAIFINANANSPRTPSILNNLRPLTFSTTAEEMWAWLFNDHKTENKIRITALNVEQQRRTVEIGMQDYDEQLNAFNLAQRTIQKAMGASFSPLGSHGTTILDSMTSLPRALSIDFNPDEAAVPTSMRRPLLVSEAGIYYSGTQAATVIPAVLLGSQRGNPSENPQRFSNLSYHGKEAFLIPPLQLIEPRLRRLLLLAVDQAPAIYFDIGSEILFPVNVMGEGISRLLSILLAIADSKDGIVLIDEIENGLHHSILASVWRAVFAAAKDNNVQVLATTHSSETILAAHEVFKDDPAEFRYTRLDRHKDESRAVGYDLPVLEAAVDMHMEVR